MTRRGKIARLPREIREQLNRRLQDGEPGNKLVTWLNSHKKVKAILRAEFNNQPINPQNLSEWNAGGYRDWLLQQQTNEFAANLEEEADQLNATASVLHTDNMAVWLATRLMTVVARLAASSTNDAARSKLLGEATTAFAALRRGDHSAQRLKLARDRLDFERELDTRDLEKLRREWTREHPSEIRERHETSWRTINQARRRLFGCAPGSEDSGKTESPNVATPPHQPPADPTKSNQIKPNQTNNLFYRRKT
jgi:hypothetical protein